ncbi:MAG: acyl carrier protein [Steroidobacteraceae bacterium]|jgi:acyl carrier protein
MTTLETIQNILIEEFKLTADRLPPQATLADLGIDSLDLVDLLFKIEDRFGLKITDDVPRSLATLGDVTAYIDKLLENQSNKSGIHSGTDGSS